MNAEEQEMSEKDSSFLRDVSSAIHKAMWFTVSCLLTSIALMLLLVSFMLAKTLDTWDKYLGKNRYRKI